MIIIIIRIIITETLCVYHWLLQYVTDGQILPSVPNYEYSHTDNLSSLTSSSGTNRPAG